MQKIRTIELFFNKSKTHLRIKIFLIAAITVVLNLCGPYSECMWSDWADWLQIESWANICKA